MLHLSDEQTGGADVESRRDFLKYSTAALLGGSGLGDILNQSRFRQVTSATNAQGGVVILLYDGMTALDAIGPYEVLRLVPGLQVRFAAARAGLIRTDSGLYMLNAEHRLGDVTAADVLLIPGGDARGPVQNPETLEWIRRLNETTTWTTSVCIGSMILGAAGILNGVAATTHWSVMDQLPHVGAKPVNERFVRDGKFISAAGVSAGIDMALGLVAAMYDEELAKTIQLIIEYDPRPPFDTGSVEKASAPMVERAREMIRAIYS